MTTVCTERELLTTEKKTVERESSAQTWKNEKKKIHHQHRNNNTLCNEQSSLSCGHCSNLSRQICIQLGFLRKIVARRASLALSRVSSQVCAAYIDSRSTIHASRSTNPVATHAPEPSSHTRVYRSSQACKQIANCLAGFVYAVSGQSSFKPLENRFWNVLYLKGRLSESTVVLATKRPPPPLDFHRGHQFCEAVEGQGPGCLAQLGDEGLDVDATLLGEVASHDDVEP